jgi:hypothetical protein
MIIDERLDRLTERHEALTQSVELLLQETRELRGVMDKDAEYIRALARIAEIYEHRIPDIERGER